MALRTILFIIYRNMQYMLISYNRIITKYIYVSLS